MACYVTAATSSYMARAPLSKLSSEICKAHHHRHLAPQHQPACPPTHPSPNRPFPPPRVSSPAPLQWSSSKKSWTRSSSANRRAHTTRMNGTPTLVRPASSPLPRTHTH